MGFLRFVTAIGTQGAISKETKKHYYVRSYKVDLSSTGEDWVTVKEGSKQKVMFIVAVTTPVYLILMSNEGLCILINGERSVDG